MKTVTTMDKYDIPTKSIHSDLDIFKLYMSMALYLIVA